jgi:hypothetical protein
MKKFWIFSKITDMGVIWKLSNINNFECLLNENAFIEIFISNKYLNLEEIDFSLNE